MRNKLESLAAVAIGTAAASIVWIGSDGWFHHGPHRPLLHHGAWCEAGFEDCGSHRAVTLLPMLRDANQDAVLDAQIQRIGERLQTEREKEDPGRH